MAARRIRDHFEAIALYLSHAAPALGWNDDDCERYSREAAFGFNWRACGSQVFSLTHSMAALLATTRSPPLDFGHLPHQAFLIEVPAKFLPLPSHHERATSFVGVQAAKSASTPGDGGLVFSIPDGDTLSNSFAVPPQSGDVDEATIERVAEVHRSSDPDRESNRRALLLTCRVASNVIAYITEHRASVRPKSRPNAVPFVSEVAPPSGMVVDREFRDLAAALIGAASIGEARAVLAHMVRGHWRNQRVGAARAQSKLTWVRPHRRGVGDVRLTNTRVAAPLN